MSLFSYKEFSREKKMALGCTRNQALYDVCLIFSLPSLEVFIFPGRNEKFDSLNSCHILTNNSEKKNASE